MDALEKALESARQKLHTQQNAHQRHIEKLQNQSRLLELLKLEFKKKERRFLNTIRSLRNQLSAEKEKRLVIAYQHWRFGKTQSKMQQTQARLESSGMTLSTTEDFYEDELSMLSPEQCEQAQSKTLQIAAFGSATELVKLQDSLARVQNRARALGLKYRRKVCSLKQKINLLESQNQALQTSLAPTQPATCTESGTSLSKKAVCSGWYTRARPASFVLAL